MTACAASFAHGSNDVANAMGPYSAIYDVWSSGQVSGKESPVRVWILAFGGGMIVFGLATCAYPLSFWVFLLLIPFCRWLRESIGIHFE